MREELDTTSEKAKMAMVAQGDAGMAEKQAAGTSMLFSGGITPEKREVAKLYAIELLKLSHGTKEFVRYLSTRVSRM